MLLDVKVHSCSSSIETKVPPTAYLDARLLVSMRAQRFGRRLERVAALMMEKFVAATAIVIEYQ